MKTQKFTWFGMIGMLWAVASLAIHLTSGGFDGLIPENIPIYRYFWLFTLIAAFGGALGAIRMRYYLKDKIEGSGAKKSDKDKDGGGVKVVPVPAAKKTK